MSDNECSGGDDGRVLTVFDTELLIKEIEKRPALYNKQLKEYSDRNLKEKLWAEVCVEVIENWNGLPAEGKKSKGTEVQKKWKNLKDCFQREMATQRNTTSGQGAKKRRKFIHFDNLLFLVPYVKGRETTGNVSRRDNDEGQERSHDTSSSTKNANSTSGCNVEELATPVRPSKSQKPVTSYEATLLNILKAKQNDEVDEDKHFALMLVPMLRQLNDEQNHYAKIDILNVMRNARYLNSQQPKPAYAEPFQCRQPAPTQVQYCATESQNLHSQNTGSLQNFYNEFAVNVLSPSSASGSELFDLSNQ